MLKNEISSEEVAELEEITSQWHSLGRQAGFSRARELFVAPTDLFRMYCF